MNEEEKGIHYPYIVFKLAEDTYCISSRYISTLLQMPEFSKIPAVPANVMGMFQYRNSAIQLLDLRTTLGMKSTVQEYETFSTMIDARKQDHIRWVQELERASIKGDPFTLGKNPHECAFGKWYDNFHTDNHAVALHLNKIDKPHRELHAAADEVERCQQNCESCGRGECLKDILKRVKEENMPKILELLDETKEVFREMVYREMVLLLDGTKWGIVVDEVVAVDDLEVIEWKEQKAMQDSSAYYIGNVRQSDKVEGIIFEVNVDTLFHELGDLDKKLQ